MQTGVAPNLPNTYGNIGNPNIPNAKLSPIGNGNYQLPG